MVHEGRMGQEMSIRGNGFHGNKDGSNYRDQYEDEWAAYKDKFAAYEKDLEEWKREERKRVTKGTS